MKVVLATLMLTASLAAEPPTAQMLRDILDEANRRPFLVVLEQPPTGTTPIPEEDQVPAEKVDPGSSVPS